MIIIQVPGWRTVCEQGAELPFCTCPAAAVMSGSHPTPPTRTAGAQAGYSEGTPAKTMPCLIRRY